MLLISIYPIIGVILTPMFFVYVYIILIPVVGIYGLVNYKKLSDYSKLVVQLTLISAFVQDYIFLPFDWITTNQPLFHAFAIASTLYFGLIYKKLFPKSSLIGKTIFYISLILVVIQTINSLFYQGLHSFPSFNIMLVASLTIVSSLVYYRYLLRFPSEQNILDFPPFWFVSGNLFFYSMNFCYLSFSYYYDKIGNEIPYFFEYFFLSSGIIILYISYLICIAKDAKSNKFIRSRDV